MIDASQPMSPTTEAPSGRTNRHIDLIIERMLSGRQPSLIEPTVEHVHDENEHGEADPAAEQTVPTTPAEDERIAAITRRLDDSEFRDFCDCIPRMVCLGVG
jgi:hypothetical protein